MPLDTWLIFLIAAIGLSFTPGPNGLLALTHGALYGVRRTVFTVMGGAYLVFLGVQVWRAPAITVAATGERPSASRWSLWQQGLLAAVTNPKGILFFVAFLPQFIDPERDLVVQFAIMATTFIVIEIVFELVLAALSQSLQPLLARVGRWFNRATGGLFVAIGVLLPWQL